MSLARIESLPTPSLIVDLDAFEANVRAADTLFAGSATSLRPHIKTHRSSGLALRQAGTCVTGVTCATVGEAEVMVQAGVSDVLLANEIVDPGKMERLAALRRRAQVMAAVDDPLPAERLADAARRNGVTIDVLIDVDIGLHRCGVAGPGEAVALARALQGHRALRLRGLMGYEGRLRAGVTDRSDRLEQAFAMLADTAGALERDGHRVDVVSAGGTSTMLEACSDPFITEVQAGTYALMEDDLVGSGLPFVPAVAILASVVSRSRDHVVVDAGLKTIGCDYGPPAAVDPQTEVLKVSEEHTTIRPRTRLELGDRVSLRPSHVRTTFNLHDIAWLVRGGDIVERLEVDARGRSQ